MCLPFCCGGSNDPPGHGDSSPTPPRAPPPTKTSFDQLIEDQKIVQDRKDRGTEELPSPTPEALQSPIPKHSGQNIMEASVAARTTPEPTSRASPTSAAKAPEKFEHFAAASPSHHAGRVAAAARPADSARTTPPETQTARRGREDDYIYPKPPSASPTVVAVPAANNVHGDRGLGDDHAHAHAHADGGKDDRKTPGRRRW